MSSQSAARVARESEVDDDYQCQGCDNEMKPLFAQKSDVPHRKLPYKARFRQIETWLDRCLRDHTVCSWGEASSQLPTRILDLDLKDGSPDIRLVDGDGKHAKYAALTYRWGCSPETIFKTTSANLQQNQARIDISNLSFDKLFFEAVQFVRSLGIQYLWIDALCIIQHDKADWLAEASRMATVYSGAHVTISASLSSSPGSRLVFDEEFSSTFLRPSDMVQEVNLGTLARRGWCLQERCLSRRIIHFGEDQIHWECSEATDSEHVGGQNWPYDKEFPCALDQAEKLLLGPLAFRSGKSLESEHGNAGYRWIAREKDPYHQWYVIMNDYTRRCLTQESDFLPALLGLINTFTAATGDRMHSSSGLWLGDLVFGLLWSRKRDGSDLRILGRKGEAQNPPPSWSWLSVPGEVLWPDNGDSSVRQQVLAITAMTLDETTMSITLRGKLLRPSELSGICHQNSMAPKSVSYSWDITSPSQRRSRNPGYARNGLEEVYVLLVVEPGCYDNLGLKGHGLALVRTSEHPESYRRVGYAKLPDLKDYIYQPPIHSLPLRTIRLESGIGIR